MFKFFLLSLVIAYANAGALLNGANLGQLSGGFTRSLNFGLSANDGSYGGQGVLTNGYSSAPSGPITAAIQSKRTYEIRPVSLPQEPAIPQLIEVDASEQPVQLLFRSMSSPVLVQQVHTPGEPGQFDATKSEDEPHRVLHEVFKPVIQEVREVIQPLRRVVQEVKPVLEEVQTIVAKGEPRVKAVLTPIPTPAITRVAKPIAAAVEAPIVETPDQDEGYGYKKGAAAKKA